MASSRRNLKNNNKRLGPDRSTDEMQLEYDKWKNTAISILNDREKQILFDRRLNEEQKTLEELSQKYKISRERIRQIENRAFEKLQKEMLDQARQQKLISTN